MLETEEWGFDPAWLEYVKRFHPGGGRVMRVNDDEPERVAFEQRSAQAFTERNIPFSYIKTYVSIQKPQEGGGYDPGYPHQHSPLSGTTLVHYLDPSDVPTPLHIMDDEKNVIEEIIPKVGMTVYIPHHIWHGVPKHKGSTPRIQLIASAITQEIT